MSDFTKKLKGTSFFFPGEKEEDFHLLADGVEWEICFDPAVSASWNLLDDFLSSHADWIFGWITYDVKNSIEDLSSPHIDLMSIPQIYFMVPINVVRWNDLGFEVLKGEWKESFRDFAKASDSKISKTVSLNPRVQRKDYIEAIDHLKQHILEGDIYEINYCQEFFAREKLEDPMNTWRKLREHTNAPFSVYVKHEDLHVMCASPERYLKRTGDRLISQPIKGTIRRGKSLLEDEELKIALSNSQKEKSENVMIVDLVRNDLSKSAKRGSVRVEELFGVHTFQTVHHLISTVSSTLVPGTTFSKIIRDTFPMGSMTGAPKVRAMQLIDKYESSSRGLYSGTIGYFSPSGDFDFNVVIRSLFYREQLPYVSCSVGGAITALSNPDAEYEECLLKSEAIIKALS